MNRRYEFAGIKIEVSIDKSIMYEDGKCLEDFHTDSSSDPHIFCFEMKNSLDPPTGKETAKMLGYRVYETEEYQERYIGLVEQGYENAYIKVIHKGRKHTVQLKKDAYENKVGVKSVLNAIGAEHLVIEKQGVILHASFIEHNGKAILFTAPSGTGKSTQADLWRKHRNAEIVNGDRAVIRLIDGKAYACGIPFAGSSTYCKNRTLPLESIVYLGQAPETTIEKLQGIQGFKKIWEGCTVNTWNQEDVAKALDIVQEITAKIPVYYLQCTPDKSAIEALESELEKVMETKKGAEGDK